MKTYLRTPGDYKVVAVLDRKDRQKALLIGFSPITDKKSLRAYLRHPDDFLNDPAEYHGIIYIQTNCNA